jgi:tRNA-dihydrouridine synthase B
MNMTLKPAISTFPASSLIESIESDQTGLEGIQLGHFKVAPISLAPMASWTNVPMRLLSRQMGAGFVVTEFVLADAIVEGDKKAEEMMRFCEEERPVGIQLYGSDPLIMARAALIAQKKGVDFIDLNFGCPTKCVVNGGAGSALLRNPQKVQEIVHEVKSAIDIPLTVKIRTGFDSGYMTGVEIAKRCEQEGVSFITVHGRTREQKFTGKANWNQITKIRQAVQMPVLGNGDIDSQSSARTMIRETGCQGVAIGRGAMGNPWIFKAFEKQSDSTTSEPSLNSQTVSKQEVRTMVLKHAELYCDWYGPNRSFLEMRKHLKEYLKPFKGATLLKTRLSGLKTYSDVADLVDDVLSYE